jgi:hypothetical protein
MLRELLYPADDSLAPGNQIFEPPCQARLDFTATPLNFTRVHGVTELAILRKPVWKRKSTNLANLI